LIGRRFRRAAYAVATALVVAAFASPALAAAKPVEEGPVVESLAPARGGPWGHWSRQRLEAAEPMSIVTLPNPESSAAPAPLPVAGPAEPEVTRTPASPAALTPQAAATARASAVEGVEVATAESTALPNSANGKLFGTYEIRVGPREWKKVDYVCSGSVVTFPTAAEERAPGGVEPAPTKVVPTTDNVVLTAGHCVIDPETGTRTNSELIFIPGYRNGTAPYGVWHAESFTPTETWKKTAKAGFSPNEGGDLAFVSLYPSDGESVEKAVGSLGIAFDGICNQVYTQFGYPAEAPYGGQLLYSHTAAYVGPDTNAAFTPVPMKIASDFTRGASGGPWAVGIGSGAAPTVRSLTAYGYESQPGFLYGPYFGEGARKAYEVATKLAVPVGIEETCAAPPQEQPREQLPNPPSPDPNPPTPAPEATPEAPPVTLKVTRVRRRANGSAVLTAKVSTAGMLKLSGLAVRAESLNTPAAGRYRMVVAPKGPTNRRLRQVGRAKVGIRVAFRASGRTKRVSKKIQLSRR